MTKTQHMGAIVPAALAGFGLESTADTKQDQDQDRGEKTAAYVREANRQAAEERFNLTCPPAYAKSDFDHPELAPYRAQIDRIRNWQFGPVGIVASGPTGRGKTRASFDLYRRLACVEGRDVRFWTAADWFNTLQQQINYGRDDARGWVEAVAARQIIIMDDLGQESLLTSRTEWAAGWFFKFLDLRIGKRLPLILSTNLGAKQLSTNMATREGSANDPLVRRLLELCEVVKF